MIEVGDLWCRYYSHLSCTCFYFPVYLTLLLQGAAEVVFARRADAVAAVKKYNNVQLDGKPMKIEIVGTNTPTAASAALPVTNGGLARNAARRYASDMHYFSYLGFIGSDKCTCIFGSVQSKLMYCDIQCADIMVSAHVH
jgi:hypothetical protein